MVAPLLIAKSDQELLLLPGLANRHGLIAGATGPRGVLGSIFGGGRRR